MELKELIKITKGKIINDYKSVKITGFKTDTRKLKKGDVYIALKGNKLNGHDYINDKLKASVIISEEDIYLKDIPVIKVKSTYDTLFYIGNYLRKKYDIPVIAITGSNGKTTLKELIYNILSKKYKVLKNDGNKNNLVGVFETVSKLNKKHDIAIFELGMNHQGEISKLSKMIEPTIGIITNIGSSHIGNLGNRKNIFKAKMEICDGLNGTLIVNGDNKFLKKTKGYKCGIKENNDLIAYNIHIYKNYLTFNVYIDDEYEIRFNIPAKDYIPSILEAIKIGTYFDIPINDIIDIISNYTMYDNRLNEIKLNNYTVIDDSYNASFESVKCGLDFIKKVDNEKIVILGDMLELGKYGKKYHKKINHLLSDINKLKVFTVGNYTKYINSIHFKDNNSLIDYLKKINLDNKYIYVKGSHGMKLEQVVKFLVKNCC